jgi:DNA polymerase III epsilon subunit-like protein
MLYKFLSTVAVIDTEATSLEAKEAEIIELGVARYENNKWGYCDALFSASKPIPPGCSAVCNISNRMVKDKPLFSKSINYVIELLDFTNTKYFVCHNVRYDQSILNSNFKRAGVDFDFSSDLGQDSWICTYRLAKKLLVKESSIEYNQQFLRYWFNLSVPENFPAHRAGSDALVCAHLLEKLVKYAIANDFIEENENIGAQLVKICWEPQVVSTWPFGKNKGKNISDLPNDFLKWAILNVDVLNDSAPAYDPDLAHAVEQEILKRPNFV